MHGAGVMTGCCEPKLTRPSTFWIFAGAATGSKPLLPPLFCVPPHDANVMAAAAKRRCDAFICDYKLLFCRYEIYRDFYVQNQTIPTEQSQHDELIKKLIDRIKEAKIRIPDKQIQVYYNSKQPPLFKRLKKEFSELSAE